MSNRLRNVCFTLNNWTDDERADVVRFAGLDYVSYLIFAEETGESGTPHLQGYFEMTKQLSLSTLKKIPGLERAHLEKANGSAADNLKYCTKERPLDFTAGEPKNPGKRTDMIELAEAITVKKMKLQEIADQYPVKLILHSKGIMALRALQIKPYNDGPKMVIWCWGETGMGKTYWAMHYGPPEDTYIHGPEMGQWWDNYDGQGYVVKDEERGQTPIGTMLRYTDEYPMQVPYKGGFVNFRPHTIIICSPKHPKDIYGDDEMDLQTAQLLRRIKQIKHFTQRPEALV